MNTSQSYYLENLVTSLVMNTFSLILDEQSVFVQ